MTTAAALEALTDRSAFEHLATSVLRRADPRYAAVIHTGVNAHGETVACPVDGLHLVPHSSPPHYVFVQHTTADRQRLRRKWLTDPDADLTKAVAEAHDLRRAQPNATFTVVLSTNQRVPADLATEVYRRGVAERVAVDIWEQGRIADRLDNTADGHWLRRSYLGVEAERLSADLLHHLGRRTADLYRREVVAPGHPALVARGVVEALLSTARPGGPTLCLVAGQSGRGKSVAAVQLLERWLAAGSLGIWLPAQFLRESVALDAAIDAWLRSLHPGLEPGAGRLAIELGGAGRAVAGLPR